MTGFFIVFNFSELEIYLSNLFKMEKILRKDLLHKTYVAGATYVYVNKEYENKLYLLSIVTEE